MSAECDGVLERIYAVLDGEVSPAEVAAIHQHLEACPPCLEEFEVEAALKALVRRCCVDQAPPQLKQRIIASVTSITSVTSVSTTTGTAVVTQVTRVTSLEG